MFNQEKLRKLKGSGEFTVWHYEADDRQEANQARNGLGFFPLDSGPKEGDAIYITGGATTSHHWFSKNAAENKFVVWLFG
jgi:hypothetical protein